MDTADEAISKPLFSTRIKKYPLLFNCGISQFGKVEQTLYCTYHYLAKQISNEIVQRQVNVMGVIN